ncbi:hypothetical protein pb186bvf_010724 [Paramecium bursaria]
MFKQETDTYSISQMDTNTHELYENEKPHESIQNFVNGILSEKAIKKQKKITSMKWTKKSQQIFEALIQCVGTDFFIIENYFKKYTGQPFRATVLRAKYKREHTQYKRTAEDIINEIKMNFLQ